MKYFFLSLFLSFAFVLQAMPVDAEQTSRSNQVSSVDSDESDDEGLNAEDDPLAEDDEEDPLKDDATSFTVPATASFPKIKTDNLYRLATGSKRINRKGFATGSDNEKENKAVLVNAFEMKNKISYSHDVHVLLRFNLTFLQEYDFTQKRYVDEGSLAINEGYVKVDRGDFNYKMGAMLLKNGPLDLDSPSNVLNMTNALAIESFDLNNLKKPIVGGEFTSVSENSSLIFRASLLKPETSGTEYTRYLEEAKQRDTNDTIEDYSEASDNIGLRYVHNFSSVSIGVSAYYWFDKDTQVNWTDTSESNATIPTSYSNTYSEKLSNIIFAGLDFDINLGKFVLKGEFYYFKDKNLYSYYKNNFNENNFTTTQADMFSSAISLEKIWGNLFVMGVYSYKKAYDVKAETNILGFENRLTNDTLVRDIESHQATLMGRYEITPKLKSMISYSQSFPIEKVSALMSLEYAFNEQKSLGLKALYVDAEEHISTSSELNSRQIFIDYKYNF